MSAFDRLHPALQHHIVNSLGWRELRPVQDLSIDAFLDGANLVILAPTAGGKTEAAFFPVISQMLTEAWDGLSVLYVSPIRALLNNQEQRLAAILPAGRQTGGLLARRHAARARKRRIVADPPDCLLTTPESLEAMLVSAKIDHRQFFQNVRAVVIDELHAFAGDDRGWHLLSVLARIQRLAGRDIQRIGLVGDGRQPGRDAGVAVLRVGAAAERSSAPAKRQAEPRRCNSTYVGSLANAAKVIRLLHQGEKAAGVLRQPVPGRATGPASAGTRGRDIRLAQFAWR